ncbi:MAG: OmpA family protein [Rubrivivax sp.]|nr:OmpA family protein [Rubrivivax sp.]
MTHFKLAAPLVLPLALWGAAALLQPGAAWAQVTHEEVNVESLVRALRSPPPTRAFMRTQLPEAGSNLCAGQAPAGGGAERLGRNLEVVPYAGDTTPGVNLSVQFATASDRLTPADRAMLDTLAAALKSAELGADRFAVAGHTDATGDARINLELSCARALAVRRYLGNLGVAAQRLTAYGFGSTRLANDRDPAAAANRRVEIRRAPAP